MKVYISSDHGGFDLKKYILENLKINDIEIIDLDPTPKDLGDDYPDKVTPLVTKTLQENTYGILICRNGVGVSMMANKFKGIRAALSWDTKHAKSSRIDDNTNVLCLPADYVSKRKTLKIIKTWLQTPFSNEERHVRRLNKVKEVLNDNSGNS